jgi:hypothetical protein
MFPLKLAEQLASLVRRIEKIERFIETFGDKEAPKPSVQARPKKCFPLSPEDLVFRNAPPQTAQTTPSSFLASKQESSSHQVFDTSNFTPDEVEKLKRKKPKKEKDTTVQEQAKEKEST